MLGQVHIYMVLLLVRISDNLNIGSNLAISYRKALIGAVYNNRSQGFNSNESHGLFFLMKNRTYYIYYSNRKEEVYCWVLLIRLIKC